MFSFKGIVLMMKKWLCSHLEFVRSARYMQPPQLLVPGIRKHSKCHPHLFLENLEAECKHVNDIEHPKKIMPSMYPPITKILLLMCSLQ
jgi:hypothetical protein